MNKEHENMINFFIASCISADSNFNNKDRKNNIETLKKFIKSANTLKATEHQIEIAKQGIEMLRKEIKDNEI